MAKQVWDVKHRPKTLDEYMFHNKKDAKVIKKYIKDGSFPHLLLKGERGTGKTSLAYLLKNVLGVDDEDFKVINASDETGVEVVRSKIKKYVTSMPYGDFRIIFLDEADRLSPAAQDTLKSMMEEHSDTSRFIITANKPWKLTTELLSRLTQFTFKNLDREDMLERLAVILAKEKVKVKNVELLEEYVDVGYPDMRAVIKLAEKNTLDGVLTEISEEDAENDELFFTLAEILVKKSIIPDRQVIFNLTDDEVSEAYALLVDNVTELFDTLDLQKRAVVVLANCIYQHSFSAYTQATLESCMIRLANL